jgi:hypothetical protein
MMLLSSNSGLRQVLEHVMRYALEELAVMDPLCSHTHSTPQTLQVVLSERALGGSGWVRPCQQALFILHMLTLKCSRSVATLCCLDVEEHLKENSGFKTCLLLDEVTQLALGMKAQPHQTGASTLKGGTGSTTSAMTKAHELPWHLLQTHACGVLALFMEHIIALG